MRKLSYAFVAAMFIFISCKSNQEISSLNMALTAGDVPLEPVGVIFDTEATALRTAQDIEIKGKYAYIASSLEGVEVIDITDPTNPTHAGAIFDDETTALYGAVSIWVRTKYAYVTSWFENGLEILDISDPAHPTHAGKIILDSMAQGIVVRGKHAYIGMFNGGIRVVDISDPAHPTYAGAIFDDGVSALNNIIKMRVKDDYLYATNFGQVNSSGNGYERSGVAVIDISDPTHPTHVASIFDDETTALEAAYGIDIQGNYAFIASMGEGLEILDISDPTHPTHLAAVFDDETTALHRVFRIRVEGKYAYLSSFTENGLEDGIEIMDISDPAHPTHVAAVFDDEVLALKGSCGIEIKSGYLYVTGFLDNGMQIFRIQH